jgi:hypothetical protein
MTPMVFIDAGKRQSGRLLEDAMERKQGNIKDT